MKICGEDIAFAISKNDNEVVMGKITYDTISDVNSAIINGEFEKLMAWTDEFKQFEPVYILDVLDIREKALKTYNITDNIISGEAISIDIVKEIVDYTEEVLNSFIEDEDTDDSFHYTNVCPDCFKEAELCECGYRGYPIEIDNGLVKIIADLNKKGYYTLACCEDHTKRLDQGYILFEKRYKFDFGMLEDVDYSYENKGTFRWYYKGVMADELCRNKQEIIKKLEQWAESLPQNDGSEDFIDKSKNKFRFCAYGYDTSKEDSRELFEYFFDTIDEVNNAILNSIFITGEMFTYFLVVEKEGVTQWFLDEYIDEKKPLPEDLIKKIIAEAEGGRFAEFEDFTQISFVESTCIDGLEDFFYPCTSGDILKSATQ